VILPYSKPGRDYEFPGYSPQYARDLVYRLKHLKADVRIDIFERSIAGQVTLFASAIRDKTSWLEVDAVDMKISSVKLGHGTDLKFDYDGSKVRAFLPKEYTAGEEFALTIGYSARPKKGLYFVAPDEHHPERRLQCWNQGEAEANRYWLPIYDYPNNKTTHELIVSAHAQFAVISNGDLLSTRERDGWRTWHWMMDRPHSTYMISVIIGEFESYWEECDGIRLVYYFPPGRLEDAKRSFSKTSDMIRFFTEYTGVKYPYASYTQTCVSEFIYGGMENITAATLTDATLHDELAHLDFSSDPLVAHELAHQWFGDLVTNKDWSHIWLNESFATYFENLFVRNDKGEEEFIEALFEDLDTYLEEYRRRYARPIVAKAYTDPEEVFDMHAYPKGGLVLHTLMNLLGEQTFRRGIKLYLERHAYGNVETDDFRRAMEEASGRSLEWFFDQFVYNAGHPMLKASYSWDPDSKLLKIQLRQEQAEDSPPVYRLPIEVKIRSGLGETKRGIVLESKEQSFFFPCDERPEMVCIDPDFKVFKVLQVEAGVENWIRQLSCPHVACRILATQALGKEKSNLAVEALGRALVEEKFWGVAARIAKAMGRMGTTDAMEKLLSGLPHVRHPKTKRAIIQALASYRDERIRQPLLAIFSDTSESYYVRHEAAVSLGKAQAKGARDTILKSLDIPSHNYAITIGGLQGLSELGGEEELRVIMERTEPRYPTLVRAAATQCLGKFPGNLKVLRRIGELSKDQFFRVRVAAVLACEELLDQRLLSLLDELSETDLDGRVRRRAKEVARRIRKHLEKGTEYKVLREEIQEIRDQNRRLLERLSGGEIKGMS